MKYLTYYFKKLIINFLLFLQQYLFNMQTQFKMKFKKTYVWNCSI